MFRSSRLITSSAVALLALGLAAATAQAGNGNGGGNSHAGGNGGGNGGGQVASNGGTHDNSGHGNMASQLGALNAAHASAEAFAHASPNSRIGKIKAYYLAEQAAIAAKADVQKAQDLVTQDEAALATAQQNLADALKAANGDATNATVVADQKIVDSLTAQLATDQQALADAQAKATSLLAQADTLLNAAANKTPVSDATRAALDALLAGKIN